MSQQQLLQNSFSVPNVSRDGDYVVVSSSEQIKVADNIYIVN